MIYIIIDSDGEKIVDKRRVSQQEFDDLPYKVKTSMLLLDLAIPAGQTNGEVRIDNVGSLRCIDWHGQMGFTRRLYRLEDHD